MLMQASALEKYASELDENLSLITQQIEGLNDFSGYLSNLVNSDEKAILSSIGKGVFLKSEIKDKNLFVEVGAGVIVRKTPQELQKVVEEQIAKLDISKTALSAQLELYTDKLHSIMFELNHSQKSSDNQKHDAPPHTKVWGLAEGARALDARGATPA